MRWTTETDITPSEWKIGYDNMIWTIGSCFADNIGQRMADRGLCVKVNPLGVLFNPISVAEALLAVIDKKRYVADQMVECQGGWHCMDFSSRFSTSSPELTAATINDAISALAAELPNVQTLIVTFGSTHIFTFLQTGKVVGNCHKLPPRNFSETDISVTDIVELWRKIIESLRRVNPGLKIIFTVSPVRHKAYGLHADRLSKSRLLLAIDELCRQTGAEYFPAYEILTDELRDYRFYADDLVHPSELACDYIFERWAMAYCTPQTIAQFPMHLKANKRARHHIIIDNIND